MSDNYQEALKYLEENIELLENHKGEEFYMKVNKEPSGANCGKTITTICYHPDIGIDMLEGLDKIPIAYFADCESLSKIQIPDSVKEIGDNAFGSCPSLKEIFGMKSVATIGYQAFINCPSLGPIINIPDSVTQIDGNAFCGCSSLKEVTGMKSAKGIAGFAFGSCTSLETIYISDSVEFIGFNVFNNCPKLTLQIAKNNQYAINYAKSNNLKYVLV